MSGVSTFVLTLDPGNPARRWVHALFLTILVYVPMSVVFELLSRSTSWTSYAIMLLLSVTQSLLGVDLWIGGKITRAIRTTRNGHEGSIPASAVSQAPHIHAAVEP